MSTEEGIYLLEENLSTLAQIQRELQVALSNKNIHLQLQNLTRIFVTTTRTALDYCAFDVFTRYCASLVPPDKFEEVQRMIQFPTFFDSVEYEKKVSKRFIDLKSNHPEIYNAFFNAQTFSSTADQWLKHLHLLSNHDKHRRLSPQTQVEEVHTDITHTGLPFTLGRYSANSSIIIENSSLNGQAISFNSKTGQHSSNLKKKEVIVWVDLEFSSINSPVIPTLHNINKNAYDVLQEIKKHLR